MKEIMISGKTGHSTIAVGEQLVNCSKYLPDTHIVIITDTTVRHIYENQFPEGDIIEIGTGESIKTLQTLHTIYEQMIQLETDRESFVLGIGGGIVCDITGFAASTYMRGLDFGFLPSTLLAQVDACVGGKNGVNVGGYKNMAGVFRQPTFAICDPTLLQTLTSDDYRSGLAEIVKHAVLSDLELFEYIEQNIAGIENRQPDVLERLIYDSVGIKSHIVNQDETEQDVRKKLNFGHTFGHALEKLTQIPHGQAVSIGMVMASSIACHHGLLDTADAERISDILVKLHLPVKSEASPEKIFQAMKKDKKRQKNSIFLILPTSIGKVSIERMSWESLYHSFMKNQSSH
ncbi:MAG: 3-dehydroquinate synthase [Candidatus Magnetomorum sp.]|nr:3-dehydroquinate synthase [Candidatus Magnetomorum sp.]